MRENGVSKCWTPTIEAYFELQIRRSRSFAGKHLLLLLRDLLKYDHRSRESKRRLAHARLRLAIASDKDLEEMAKIICNMPTDGESTSFNQELNTLRQLQAGILKRRVKLEEL